MAVAKSSNHEVCTYWLKNKCRKDVNCNHKHYYQSLIFGDETKLLNGEVEVLGDEYEQGRDGKVLVKVSTFTTMR